MNSENISKKILDTIDRENICPKSRAQFVVKNILMWTMGVLSLVLGAITFAEVLFVVVNNNWDIARYLERSGFGTIIRTLPYLWIASTVIFVIAADYVIRSTKHGYRYSLPVVVFGTIGVSVVFGGVLYTFGLGHTFDTVFANTIPVHTSVLEQKKKVWLKPEQGFLIGSIAEFDDARHALLLTDAQGNDWIIYTTYAKSPRHDFLVAGQEITVVGNQVTESTFDACAIHPLHFRGMMGHSPRMIIRDVLHEGGTPLSNRQLTNGIEGERKEVLERIYRCKQDPAYQFIHNVK